MGNALSNVIAEVNKEQSILNVDKDNPNAALAAILGITHVKSVLEEAWKATRIMDGFDMEADYKSGRYSENRSILKGLCEQMGVSTSTYTPSSSSQPTHRNTSSTARPYSSASNRATVNRQTTSTNYSSSSSSDGPPWGCFIVIAIYIIIFLISICS